MRNIWIGLAVVFAFLVAGTLSGTSSRFYVKPEQLRSYEQEYGPRAVKRLNALLSMMNTHQNASEEEKLKAVNRFFNQVPYRRDIKAWGKSDYWASRLEFLGKGMGDCEDYAVAKYLTLSQLGVPQERLFMTYVRARGFSEAAHMVVSYYTDRKAVPLVLDNYDKRILPATQRKDLIPVYSFTAQDLFLQKQKGLGKRVDPSKVKTLKKLRSIDLEIYKG
ncbi:MAG: transglutaminase-like cysteine peptidase [Desulfobacterales bacterium]|nr:transglutaminase-like cysteine peptidase [Desulfobacterales bacterium]